MHSGTGRERRYFSSRRVQLPWSLYASIFNKPGRFRRRCKKRGKWCSQSSCRSRRSGHKKALSPSGGYFSLTSFASGRFLIIALRLGPFPGVSETDSRRRLHELERTSYARSRVCLELRARVQPGSCGGRNPAAVFIVSRSPDTGTVGGRCSSSTQFRSQGQRRNPYHA